MSRFVPISHEPHDACFAEEAAHVLADAGLRVTRPRRAVVELLERTAHPMDPGEMHKTLTQQGIRIDRASVYRVLDVLREQGLVHHVLSTHGFVACHPPSHVHAHGQGEPADHSCHHHMLCKACGKALEVHCDGLSGLLEQLSQMTGFKVEGHTLEVAGTCRECQQAAAQAATPAAIPA